MNNNKRKIKWIIYQKRISNKKLNLFKIINKIKNKKMKIMRKYKIKTVKNSNNRKIK